MSVAGQARHIRGSMELLYDTRQETNILHALIRDAKTKPATVSSRPIGSVNAGPTFTNTNVFTEPIAFHPIAFIITSDEPDTLRIDKNFGAYSSRVIVTGFGGTDDDITTIVGLDDGEGNTGKAAFAGQYLVIDAALSGDLTLKEGTTFSLPGAVDYVIAAGQNVELIFDSTSDRWQLLATSGDASQWSTFPALNDINFATFDGINIDRLRFVISSGAPVTTGDPSILRRTGGDLQLNLPTGSNFDFTIQDVDVATIDDTFAIFRNAAGVYVLELQNDNPGIIDLDQIGEFRFKGQDQQAGSLVTYGRILVNADDVNPTTSLDARMTLFVMRDGNSEAFITLNQLGSNEILFNKLLNMNNQEINNTAGIFPQDNGLDDIGGLSNSYNSVYMDALHFVHSQVQVAGERMISFEGGGDMEYNVPIGNLHVLRFQGVDEYLISDSLFQFKNLNQLQFLDASDNQDIKINYQDPVFLINLSGSSTQFKINNDAIIPDFVLEGENTGAALLAHAFLFQGKSATGVTREYGSIKVRQTVVTNTLEDGAMEFALIEAGVADVPYVDLNAQFQQVRILKELNLNNNKITGIDFTNFNERMGDPTVGANEGVLYVKDVSMNSHLFFDNNTEAPVDLSLGGGGGQRSATVVVAASNATAESKAGADFVCDGTADEVQINSAIDIATTVGGIVQLTEGRFTIAGSVIMKDRVHLQGVGAPATLIIQPDNNNKNIIETEGFAGLTGGGTTGGVKGFEISDLRVDGNKDNDGGPPVNTGQGIVIYGNRFRLTNLEVTETESHGIYSEWAVTGSVTGMDTALEAFLNRVKIGPSTNGDGILWRGPHDSHMTDIVSFGNQWGIHFEKGANFNGAGTGLSGVHCFGGKAGGIQDDAGNLSGTDIEVEAYPQEFEIGILLLRNAVNIEVHGAKNFIGIQIGDTTHAISGLRIEARFGVPDLTPLTATGINFANDAGKSMITLLGTFTGNATSGTINSETTYHQKGQSAALTFFKLTGDLSLNTGLKLNFDGGTSQTYITEDASDNMEFHIDTADFFEFFAAEGDSNPILTIESDGTLKWNPDGHEIAPQGGSLDFGVAQTNDAFEFLVDVQSTPELAVRIEDDLFRKIGANFQVMEIYNTNNAVDGSSIGDIEFHMDNSGGSKVNYAAISGTVHVASTTSANREGRLEFLVTHGSSNSAIYAIEGGESNTTSRLGWYDKATNPTVQQTLPSNPTTLQISTVLRNYGLTKL